MITIRRPDDFHLHLRDGAMLPFAIADTAKVFARAIIMPNLMPAITTTAQAEHYATTILAALPTKAFQPMMTLYLHELMPVAEIHTAAASDTVFAIKLYPAGVTTNSAGGINNFAVLDHLFSAMAATRLPLLIHGEVNDPGVDIFDREAVFIERILKPLLLRHPTLRVVLEHITTQQSVACIRDYSQRYDIAATITPQHLLGNRNDLFQGGLQPHWYCLPILKRGHHQRALIQAATSGEPCFFAGSDSAPHPQHAKESACGCAGCYTGLHAIQLYTQVFAQANALNKLNDFTSVFGARYYGLPLNGGTLTLSQQQWSVPHRLVWGNTTIIPLLAGKTLDWNVV